ncbi:MAG: ABC transporter substrate-binding protein [Promethearchaeota archaeon]
MKNKYNKKILISLLFLVLILNLSCNMSLGQAETNEDEPVSFVLANQGLSSLATLDPNTYYANPEMDVVFLVTEGLVTFVYHGEGLPTIEPCLATSWNYVDSLTLDVDLRENTTFSDGTPWNGTTCKWNMDRFYEHVMNPWVWAGGSDLVYLPSDPYRDVTGVDLDWLPEGEYLYLINNTEVVSEYKVRFNLNVPFDLINAIFPHRRMISPVAHSEYYYDALPAAWTEDKTAVLEEGLIGTGPYVLDEINFEDETITCNVNPNWWGPEPEIEIVTFRYFSGEPQTMSIALAAGDVDGCAYVEKELLINNTDVVYFEENRIGVGSYIGMFPEKINFSVREAFNYAFDYEYFIDEVLGGSGSMPTGAIFVDQTYQNDDVNPPEYNLTKAREILIDSGVAPSSASDWTDDDWKDVADGDGPVSPLGNYVLGYMDLQ